MNLTRRKLLCVGRVAPDPAWRLEAHWHHFHEIVVVFSGEMSVRLLGEVHHAATGDILFYPQGARHEEWSDTANPAETYFIGFESLDKAQAGRIPTLSHDLNGRVHQLMSWLYADRDLCSAADQTSPQAFVNAIVAEIQRLNTVREDPLIAVVRRYIHAHIDREITLDGLAAQVGMSKFHFLRKYKELTGLTPMQDVRTIRAECARELILTSNLQLKAIAPKVGLNNIHHLSHIFRKQLHLTPGEVRKKSRH